MDIKYNTDSIEDLSRKAIYSLNFDNNDIDDLLQVARLAYFEAMESYDKKKNDQINAYILMVMRRRVINELTTIANHKNHYPLLENEKIEEDKDNRTLKSYPILFENEEFEFLLKEFESVIKRTKTCYGDRLWQFVLDIYNGLSYEEIARKHNVSRKIVDSSLCRMRYELKGVSVGGKYIKKSNRKEIPWKDRPENIKKLKRYYRKYNFRGVRELL